MDARELEKKISALEAELAALHAEAEQPREAGRSEPSPEAVAAVKKMTPLDDLLFTKMAEDPEVCREVIETVLWVPVKVLSAVPQKTLVNLQGRGVRLDTLTDVVPAIHVEAELRQACHLGEKGAKINIEVQQGSSSRDDYQKRSLFNAASILTNFTQRGTEYFRDIPDVIVIFISSFDMFQLNKTYYRIKRVIDGTDIEVFNGMSEFYVNTAIEDNSTPRLKKLTDLMRLFRERDTFDYGQFPRFSERKNQFQNTEEGVRQVSEELQELFAKKLEQGREQGREEGRKEGREEGAIRGTVTVYRDELGLDDRTILEKIVSRFHLTDEQARSYVFS